MDSYNAESVPLWQRLIIGRRPKRTLLRAATLALALLGTFHFILVPVRITGKSMEPAYRDKSVNLINLFAYRNSKPKRGDVVGVKTTGVSTMFFKRVIALPGETAQIHGGEVMIDDQVLDEPYVHFRDPWEMPPRKLSNTEYLVIGDNRGMPQEYHSWGVVEFNQIAGKAVW